MAGKQLRRERQTMGRALHGIIQRVKAVEKATAELYETRERRRRTGPGLMHSAGHPAIGRPNC